MPVELTSEDRQEYTERLGAIMPSFCAPEDQLVLNLARYWGCPDADGTLQELLEAGLLEKSPTGGYRQPLRPWTPATVQVEAAPEPPVFKPVPVPTTPLTMPSIPVAPAPIQSTATPGLKPLRLARPTVTR